MPRATVSAAVAQVEGELGVRLLQRTTRSVRLTADGAAALEHARGLIEEFNAFQQSFRTASPLARGRLHVDLPSRIARRIVLPALPGLLSAHPELEIDIGSDDRRIDLVEEGVDCAIRVGALPDSSLVARPLGTARLINCASPAYLAAHPRVRTRDDLRRHWAIHYEPSRRFSAHPGTTGWLYLDADGVEQCVPLRCRVQVHTTEAYFAGAIAGLGLVQVPAFDARDAIARGDLVEVLPRFRPAPLPVNALYPHRRHLSPRVRVFLDWLEGLLVQWLD